jgi:hypothetical protein
MDLCEMLKRTYGCKWKVPFITSFKYGGLGMFVPLIVLSFSTILSYSSFIVFATFGH